MCGRFVAASSSDDIAAFFDAASPDEPLPANFNVAPSTDILAVVEGSPSSSKAGQRLLEAFHWGLVPRWAKDIKVGYKMINARSEGLATKNAFKPAFRSRRCIIPADGFYEWKKLGGGTGSKVDKQPYFIHARTGEPLAFAGLWERWRDPEADDDAPLLHSATIITTGANEMMASLHDRMPVILPASAWDRWLDPSEDDLDELSGLLVPAPDDLLVAHAVDTRVGNVRNRGAELVEPIVPERDDAPAMVGRSEPNET